MTDHEELAKRARDAFTADHAFSLYDWDNLPPDLRDAWLAVARAIVPEGWAVVPVEPTPEMVEASEKADEQYIESGMTQAPGRMVYAAMLAAAPSP